MGRVSVSECRCCEFVSKVQPVMILSAVFCCVCSFVMLVLDMIGDQMVLAYSKMGLVIVLYVVSNVSFVLPQCVVVSDFRTFIVFLLLVHVLLMCFANVCFGSNVMPRILGSFCVGIGVLLMCKFSCVLYSAGSGVKSVEVVLVGFSVS